MEFKHFSPIGPVTAAKIIPNFTGGVDVFSPTKNLAHFEEVAASAGLTAVKGAIIKNTLQFFQPQNQFFTPTNKVPLFPEASANAMPHVGYNVFGFPIFSNLIIKGDTYQDNNGNTIGSFSDIRLDCVIMELSREKNLVKEDIQGHNGTIIEYISSKSVGVHVYGRILAKTPGVYPIEDVTNFNIALESNKALRVTSWFLSMAKVYNIVIDKDSIKQEEGSQEYQKFEFDAISQEPVILKLKR